MAAARDLSPIRTINKDLIIIAGSFAPNGSSAISAASKKGRGWTVAYTSTGLYTITFGNVFPHLISFVPGLQHPTAVDLTIQAGVYTAASKTITVTTLAVATPTDVAADANARIHFIAIFANTTQIPLYGA